MSKPITTIDLTKAINRGVRDSLREHALLGQSVSVWKDGQVVELSPEEILKTIDHQETRNGKAQ